jgi:hypothetical protein
MGISTAPCKFCGQLVKIQDMPTGEGAAEAATMACECQEAVSYRREKKRRERTLDNVRALFGKGEDSDGAVQILLAAAEGVLDGEITKIALTLYDGTKASISQTSKGDINVERTETVKRRLTG